MMLNDQYGDCSIAALGHAKQTMTAANGNEVTVPDSAILQGYEAITCSEGACFDPTTGANDNGANLLDVMNLYRQQGFFGEKLDAYAAVTPGSPQQVKEAIWLLGGCYIGVQLPAAWQGPAYETNWSVPSHIPFFGRRQWTAGSWGGHCVWVFGYDANNVYLYSWGEKITMTWQAFFVYVDEAYALYKKSDWLNTQQIAPNGFDDAALLADAQALGAAA